MTPRQAGLTEARRVAEEIVDKAAADWSDAVDLFERALIEYGNARLEQFKSRLDMGLNDHLVEMKDGFDDSITGFNEAWGVMSKLFRALKETSP